MFGFRVREELKAEPRFYVESLLETTGEFTNTTDLNYSNFEAELACPLAA